MFLRVKPMLQIDAIELSLRIRAAPDHHPCETCILAAIIRASVSVGPPAANGNTIVIGRDGYVSQGAGQQHSDEHITDRKTHDHCLDSQLQVASSIS
jgi:hypothetical protein